MEPRATRYGRRKAPQLGRGAPTRAPESTLPPPTTRWRRGQRGSPAREVGVKRGGETRQKQKGAPRLPHSPSPLRSAEAGGEPGAGTPGRGKGLTFSCRSRRRRPPWRIGPRDAFLHGRRPPGSLRPKRWFPPHAERKGEQVQGRECKAGSSSGDQRREQRAAIAGVPVLLKRLLRLLVRAWPTHCPQRRREDSPRVPLGRGGSVH
jgi:hypothetical protein